MSRRIILVSNRLPVTARVEHGTLHVERSVGGLATGLAGATRKAASVWIGWPGPISGMSRRQSSELNARLTALDCVPVALSSREVREYYEDVSNGILWPLFHYQAERMPPDPRHWSTYAGVNARFAQAVAAVWRPGDEIWIHDYQLLLLPALLRHRLPEALIGFFLHIPFPAVEIFRILPWREEVLDGMLGADLVGFHTESYAHHFATAARELLGVQWKAPNLVLEGRDVRVGAYPIGIDAQHFESLARRRSVQVEAEALTRSPEFQVIAGVDRLDYTKGIPRRLLAFERLLTRHPELHGRVQLVQVVVPSRTGVRSYREFRTEVDAAIGNINGAFGTALWTPVAYQYRSLPEDELSALYSAADVMLVTPIRDGMNLVSKEYVASRVDGDGVLVLSEFTGAAAELTEALLVNPYDVDGMAAQLYRALTMDRPERKRRMSALRKKVLAHDATWWATTFLGDLRSARKGRRRTGAPPAVSAPEDVAAALEHARNAPALLLFLDYDGTLVPFTPRPDAARPDLELLALLSELAARPNTIVHLVSGRSRDQLAAWLGDLPVALHAEHGLWSRAPRSDEWQQQELGGAAPYDRLASIMNRYAEETPGALVERKTAGVAWHYRMADLALGAMHAERLAAEMEVLAGEYDLDVLRGDKVIEVRPTGIHKGRIVTETIAELGPEWVVLAMGDDRTDEDLFEALPEGSIAIHVGPRESRASIRLPDVATARAFLRELASVPAGTR
ncbi:MAG TPA: bifunctional alpha,alpha-trehalose-phosphate synthase (UDP-forming)/trehalose-phosphatase [Gemmatimonadales bacterium]|nr:bifunctional alpha,alpha-trehalose-phosphate synthase (UDP-forming)/trehalose-phosphatase [Gemmatimonadales bacterium]